MPGQLHTRLLAKVHNYIQVNVLLVIADNNIELSKPFNLLPKPPIIPSKHIEGEESLKCCC